MSSAEFLTEIIERECGDCSKKNLPQSKNSVRGLLEVLARYNPEQSELVKALQEKCRMCEIGEESEPKGALALGYTCTIRVVCF